MKLYLSVVFCIVFSLSLYAQKNQEKVKVTGLVTEQNTGLPLEFATVTFQNIDFPERLAGGMTDEKGKFEVDIPKGKYTVKVEFISYTPFIEDQISITGNKNMGNISLAPDAQMLNEVVVTTERTTVEMKLDKKVYNLGQDLMVKGGTASDVLDNVPSISVDAEGNVLLRGNENVRILIDGRLSNALDINDALRMIPAESLDKIEVITNPSARYDAEGSSGIINIILKKGKVNGTNGLVTATLGNPQNSTLTGNMNYKTQKFNLYTTQSFTRNDRIGSFFSEAEFLNRVDGSTSHWVTDNRKFERSTTGYNGNAGVEWFITPRTVWNNMFIYSQNLTDAPVTTKLRYFDEDKNPEGDFLRTNTGLNTRQNMEFVSNFQHQFSKEGHKLTMDFSYSENKNDEDMDIQDIYIERNIVSSSSVTQLYQLDYVLPLGGNKILESGYRGNFLTSNRDFTYERFEAEIWNNLDYFSHDFTYIENVNALYTQFADKIGKINYLMGLRWEYSDITTEETTSDFRRNKVYDNFFPSATINYEFSTTSGMAINYSRRIQRPRGRQLNPFSNISSNINIFQGNPDLDPVFTDVVDLSFIQRWDKVTFNASAYYNYSINPFQFVRRESGLIIDDGTPVIFTGPVNAGVENRAGLEFTVNYNPVKKLRINTNFNFFRTATEGEYVYTNLAEREVVVNLDNQANAWFARINTKYTLPYKIDWQTNLTYNSPQRTFQGRVLGITAMNLAFSKDILKDKATVSFNINDVFNSRRRIFEADIPNFMNSYVNFQWMQRQLTLAFTYRFNRKKSDRENNRREMDMDGGGMM